LAVSIKHALAVDDILDTLLLMPEPVLHAPSLNHGPARGLAAQALGKVQIRNTKEVFSEIVSVD
jgi:hypothetical protein